MDILVKKLPASRVEMSVTLAWDEWKKAVSYTHLTHRETRLFPEIEYAGEDDSLEMRFFLRRS